MSNSQGTIISLLNPMHNRWRNHWPRPRTSPSGDPGLYEPACTKLPSNTTIQLISRTILLLTVFFTASLAGWGATITSVKDGDWSDASTWDNGIPGPSDNVIITYDVTIDNAERANCYDLTIKPGVYLYVKTGLLVGNNFKMEFDGDTDSYFEMEDGAYVVVAGNVELSNKVNLHLASYFIVKGNITGATSGQTELSIEDGSHIYFLKDVDKQLKLTSECGGNYDETNNYNSSKCDYGALEDYVEDFDSFPEEVKKALKCSSLTFHTNSISIAP